MKKYERIYAELKKRITTLDVREGDQLPTDQELMERYDVSRPTVGKALRMLVEEGLVLRGPGVGSFVRSNRSAGTRKLLFGLVFPETGHGEIFAPIMSHISAQGSTHDFSLMWGTSHNPSGVFSVDEMLALIREYAQRRVNGVFFAPLEGGVGAREANRQAVEILEQAGIPIVLVDRDMEPFPRHSKHPLVGIDNIRAGYMLAQHYLEQGAERIDFGWLPYAGYTIELRIRGYQTALLDAGLHPRKEWVHYGDPADLTFVERMINAGATNVIWGNDEEAAVFMNTLRDLSINVPQDVRVAGFDDVKYSHMIYVPLTTIRQPVRLIAEKAVREMLTLVNRQQTQTDDEQDTDVEVETIVLMSELVVRESSLIPNGGNDDGEQMESAGGSVGH
jgi:DNA-binding LacI/PurR family transcriptional regulator